MWCRNILNIQLFKLFRFFLLLFDLLCLWLQIIKIRKVQKLYARNVHHLAQIHRTIVHHIKASLHTVRTHRDIIRKFNHLSRHTLRAMTNKTYSLISVIIFFRMVRSCHFFFFFFPASVLSVVFLVCLFFIYNDKIIF